MDILSEAKNMFMTEGPPEEVAEVKWAAVEMVFRAYLSCNKIPAIEVNRRLKILKRTIS